MISVIISEYNPLHNGHIYHINFTKDYMSKINGVERNYIIAIMSGNFTQRGDIAILNKYTRTWHALHNGIDMVIELPSIYATSSAEFFAKGALEIINNINNIDYISFGSELGDIESIKAQAELYSNQLFDSYIKQSLDNGLSYPAASSVALSKCGYNIDTINCPNNVLGVEYYKQAKALGMESKLITTKRIGGSYNNNSLLNNYSSASAIRQACKLGNYEDIASNLPVELVDELRNSQLDYNKLLSIVSYQSISTTKVYEDKEGVINRIRKFAQFCNDYDSLVDKVHTKRYTKSKIRRILLHLALQHTYDMTKLNNIKVLGVRKDATHLLSLINKDLSSAIINDNDILANSIYNIVSSDKIVLDKMLIV